MSIDLYSKKRQPPTKGAGRVYGGNDGLAFRVMYFRAKPKIQREKRKNRQGGWKHALCLDLLVTFLSRERHSPLEHL